jgi:GDP-L-fucose synthase
VTEKYGEQASVNIKSGQEITIKEIVDVIARLTEFERAMIWDTSRPEGKPKKCWDYQRRKLSSVLKQKQDSLMN